jgi:hypothetical protein
MSGPGRPTLCKPEHAGRARALCARRAANPDRAGHRERILWVECTPKVRQIKPGQFLRRGTDEATIERNG